MINTGNVGKIKRGAYLVNTARGGLIETAALLRGLEEGVLAGVGLDVLEEEEDMRAQARTAETGSADEVRMLAANNALRAMPNVLITPHTAFNSAEAVRRILDTTLESIRGFAAGKPANLVPKA